MLVNTCADSSGLSLSLNIAVRCAIGDREDASNRNAYIYIYMYIYIYIGAHQSVETAMLVAKVRCFSNHTTHLRH